MALFFTAALAGCSASGPLAKRRRPAFVEGDPALANRPGAHDRCAALSPDGELVAYFQGRPDAPFLVIASVDEPGRTALADLPEASRGAKVAASAHPWLRWLDSGRIAAGGDGAPPVAFDANGRTLPEKTLTTAPAADERLTGEAPPVPAPVQALFASKLPGRHLLMLGGDARGRRFLALARDPGAPGRFFAYEPSSDLLYEVGRADPLLP